MKLFWIDEDEVNLLRKVARRLGNDIPLEPGEKFDLAKPIYAVIDHLIEVDDNVILGGPKK